MFQYRSKVTGSVRWTVVGIVVVVALGLFIGPWVRDVVVSLLDSSARATEYSLLPRSVLVSRLAAAEAEVARTRYQAVLYESLASRIRELEGTLALKQGAAYAGARVVAAPPRTHYDTLVISLGAADGVQLSDVATVEGIAVGTVTDVGNASSIIELYSSPGAEHDAEIGSQKAIVVVRGVGGGSMETSVPDDLSVQVGDTVRDVRTGTVMGAVISITRREIDTEAFVRIALPVQPSAIRHVSLTHAP